MPLATGSARRSRRRAAMLILVSGSCGAALAQYVQPPSKPAGFAAGPVVLAPSLTAGYAYDSNIFLRPDDLDPVSDQVLTVQPAFFLSVPFSNSSFTFGDTLRYVDYAKAPQTNGKLSNDATAELHLVFGSLDELTLSAHNIAGVAETLAFDPGGEVTFAGKSYQLHTESAQAQRDVAGARGYRVGLTRNALHFDPDQDVAFFNYRGFDGEASYLEPLGLETHMSLGYLGTRYDHFDTSPGSDPYAVFRTESGDSIFATFEGRLSPRQPYEVRIGWERLAFTGNDSPDYSGVIVRANASFVVGGGTTFVVGAIRQPFRSFFYENNFYVMNQLHGGVARTFDRGTALGLDLYAAGNRYQVPVPAGRPSAGIVRSDRTYDVEAYANLALRERVAFRISISEHRRNSNFSSAQYNETVVFGGFSFGWF